MTTEESFAKWKECAMSGVMPYGYARSGDLEVYSKVVGTACMAVDNVQGSALLYWVFVNSSPRRIRLRGPFDATQGLVAWTEECRIPKSISKTHSSTMAVNCERVSRGFSVVSPGVEKVESQIGTEPHAKSVFWCILGEGGDMPTTFDWIGLFAKVIEGVPGANLVIGPLLRAYDQERAGRTRNELNARLDDLAASQRRMEADFIAAFKESGPTPVADVVGPVFSRHWALLEKAAKDGGIEVAKAAILVSHREFPLLISKDRFVEEIVAIYPNQTELHDLIDVLHTVSDRFVDTVTSGMKPGVAARRLATALGSASAWDRNRILARIVEKRESPLLSACLEAAVVEDRDGRP